MSSNISLVYYTTVYYTTDIVQSTAKFFFYRGFRGSVSPEATANIFYVALTSFLQSSGHKDFESKGEGCCFRHLFDSIPLLAEGNNIFVCGVRRGTSMKECGEQRIVADLVILTAEVQCSATSPRAS